MELQKFQARHPETGVPTELANLVVRWHPDRLERVLLCAHYDTRPYPDQDPNPALRRGVFIGANDGASCTALLAEIGKHMAGFDSPVGVDFVLFDGEEFVITERDEYFLGSTYFGPGLRPRTHRTIAIAMQSCLTWWEIGICRSFKKSTACGGVIREPLVLQIWRTARKLGVREFIYASRYEIRDDHLPLNNIAGIPCL